MRKTIALCCALAALGGLPAALAAAETATYDLLFRSGTLDHLPRDQALIYHREVSNSLTPDAATRDTGDIALSFSDGVAEQADLQFRQDGKHRNLGSFPASVGNPIIMYFYETVVRDMAETAGGSPFYIRNRVKDALTRQWAETPGTASYDGQTVATRSVTLRPFAEDPNRAAMRGFGDLALTVTMSDAVPGWYLSLEAHVPGAEADTPVYHSDLRFQTLEPQS